MENTHKLAIGVGGSIVLITILLLSYSGTDYGSLFVENSKLDFKNQSFNDADYLISLKDVVSVYPTHSEHFYLLLVQNNKPNELKAPLDKSFFVTTGPQIIKADLYLVHNLSMQKEGFAVQYHKVDSIKIPSQLASWYLIKLTTLPFQKGEFNVTIGEVTLDPEISACGTINTPGIYNLTSGITNGVNCFSIETSNVSFNCAGLTLDGNGSSSGYAFSVVNQTNISLSNCTITEFQTPIQFTNSNGSANFISLINNTEGFQTFTNGTLNISNSSVLNQTKYFYSNSPMNQTITNFTFGISNTSSRLYYPLISATTLNLTNNSNLIIDPSFVSINSSALASLNTSATIFLTSTNCTSKNIMKKFDYPVTAADIIANGTYQGKQATCVSGIANFNVSSFSGYALNTSNYNVSFANPNGSINLVASAPYQYNNTPDYQNVYVPSLNFTNNLNTTIWNITVYLNETLSLPNGSVNLYAYNSPYRPPNITQNWSGTGNGIVTIPFLMTNNSSTVIIRRIRANESVGVWFWADFINVTDNQTKSIDILVGGGN